MKNGYFEDAKGNKSSNRVMAFLALVVALVISLSCVFIQTVTFGDAFPIIITLLAYSIGTKSFQNVLELRRNTDEK